MTACCWLSRIIGELTNLALTIGSKAFMVWTSNSLVSIRVMGVADFKSNALVNKVVANDFGEIDIVSIVEASINHGIVEGRNPNWVHGANAHGQGIAGINDTL